MDGITHPHCLPISQALTVDSSLELSFDKGMLMQCAAVCQITVRRVPEDSGIRRLSRTVA